MFWSKEEIDYLKENYPLKTVTLGGISNHLNKSKIAITHKAARIGLSRPNMPSNKPSDLEHRKNYDKKYYEKNKEKIYSNKRTRIKNNKTEILKELGNKCSICGYDRCINALEFHHPNKNKNEDVTNILKNYSRQKALKEAKKCIILCANCHREVHHKGA